MQPTSLKYERGEVISQVQKQLEWTLKRMESPCNFVSQQSEQQIPSAGAAVKPAIETATV